MIIVTASKGISGVINEIAGTENKPTTNRLFTITIPSQLIIYDVSTDSLEESPIEIIVKYERYVPEGEASENKGSWPVQTFVDFVDGVKAVTESAVPFIKNGRFTAQAKITETTYIWSRFAEEKVAGGFLSVPQYKQLQQVKFEILGLASDYVRWHPDMLDVIITLKEKMLNQREGFLYEVRGKSILPEKMACSHCQANLTLDMSERVDRKFRCPKCNKMTDLTDSNQ